MDFSQLKITATYEGGTQYNASSLSAAYAPWKTPTGLVFAGNAAFLTAQPNSARIGGKVPPPPSGTDPGYFYGTLSVGQIDAKDVAMFKVSTYHVEAFVRPQSVPELSTTVGFAVGLFVLGGLVRTNRESLRTT